MFPDVSVPIPWGLSSDKTIGPFGLAIIVVCPGAYEAVATSASALADELAAAAPHDTSTALEVPKTEAGVGSGVHLTHALALHAAFPVGSAASSALPAAGAAER